MGDRYTEAQRVIASHAASHGCAAKGSVCHEILAYDAFCAGEDFCQRTVIREPSGGLERDYRKAALTGLLSNVVLMHDVGAAVHESVDEKRTHSEDAMRRWEQVVAEMAFRMATAMMEREVNP